MQTTGAGGVGLWNEEDRFYFDVIRHGASRRPLRIYSMVGLVPMFAALVVERATVERVPGLLKAIEPVLESRPHLRSLLPGLVQPGRDDTRLLSIVDRERLTHLMARVLDETEFLSDYGVRSLSRAHADHPLRFEVEGQAYEIGYRPAASDDRVFGGNSNWRGPIWFPMNFLLIQAIATFARYYDNDVTLEHPRGSGRHLTLAPIADELAQRLTRLFVRWRDYVPFHEFFHGDTGAGLGASHQTGWTALVALLLQYGGNLCFDREAPRRDATALSEAHTTLTFEVIS
jgi:hypothetical protein